MTEEKKTVPVLLLTGYLGSGKTTLVNHILTNERGIRFAVIVNDIGEVNIDAELISKGGLVGKSDDSLVALQNGCICCTLKMDLVEQIVDLLSMDAFDYIVIEASGICEPEPIAQTICSIPVMAPQVNRFGTVRLDSVVTVVDALRLRSEFACGDTLAAVKPGEEELENLIIQQIEFCNTILLNKISEVSAEEADRIKAIIARIQPGARIIECDYADVDLAELIDTHEFDFERVATSATWIREIERPVDEIEVEEEHHHHHHNHHCDDPDHCHCHHHHHHHHHGEGEAEEYGISTFVYYRRQPFDLNKFDWFMAKQWPKEVIRAKGICYFSENPDITYLFEQAGVQKKLTDIGQWYATAPEEDLVKLMAANPDMMRDWDETYGDRMEKIVFIGRNMDRVRITADLDACLADE